MKVKTPILAFLFCYALSLRALSADGLMQLKKAGNDDYRVMADKKKLAELMPDNWQGNLNIFSTENKTMCGVNWPHFLLYSEGKWLTDKVESEGMKLLEFKTFNASGPVIGYRGKWMFRDYCVSSESHFIWHDAATATQVHLVKAKLEILKDLPDISSTWVEFMTPVNSYTTVAAKVKNAPIVTVNLSQITTKANTHYLDGYELADDGWIMVYGARKGQAACVALVPLNHSSTALHPRVYDWNVDNIEIHALDARKSNFLTKGRTFSLEYLLIVGPDQQNWRWIDATIQNARLFMSNNASLLEPTPTTP